MTMTTTAPRLTCSACEADVTDLFTITQRDDGGFHVDGGGTYWEVDYFGDGRLHPIEDFPAPVPLTMHGVRATRDGSAIHACGTMVNP